MRGTTDYGKMYSRQQGNPSVVGYVDADYVIDLGDRRSTTGYVFTLAKGLICWKSMVQSLVALSNTKSEYMKVAEAVKKALWLTCLFKELSIHQDGV